MSKQTVSSIPGTDEAWDTGELGADENYVEVAPNDENVINAHLELQPISIRLEKSLIDDFKLIATLSAGGMGYQPLMRQCLKRFAEGEIKRLLRAYAAEKVQAEAAEEKRVKKQSKAA